MKMELPESKFFLLHFSTSEMNNIVHGTGVKLYLLIQCALMTVLTEVYSQDADLNLIDAIRYAVYVCARILAFFRFEFIWPFRMCSLILDVYK